MASRASVTLESGVLGDAWGRQARPALEAQLAVMHSDIAGLIANGQPLTLFGDTLFLELDLSAVNLPFGSPLRTGTATVEVTLEPHNGCSKFRERFGGATLRLVSRGNFRHFDLRGVYMLVVEDEEIAAGELVQLLSREPQRRDD